MEAVYSFLQHLRKHWHFILPISSGILLSFSLPTIGFAFVLWFAFVPLLFWTTQYASAMRVSFWGGLLAGTLYGTAVLLPLVTLNAWWWVDHGSFLWNIRHEMFAVFLFFVAMVFYGLSTGLFVTLYHRFRTQTYADAIIFGGFWSVLEMTRSLLVLGFTWGELGYAFYSTPPIVQFAHFGGTYSIGFFVVAANILLYYAILRISDNRYPHFVSKYYYALVLLVFLIALYGFGNFFLQEQRSGEHKLRVAIIHTGLTTAESTGERGFTFFLEHISKALESNPDMVVLPENSFPFITFDEKSKVPKGYEVQKSSIRELYDKLVQVSIDYHDTAIIFGAHSFNETGFFNSMLVMESGVISGTYHKRKLMPFGEAGAQLFGGLSLPKLERGAISQSISSKEHYFTSLICSEIIFPDLAKDERSSFIVNISNDSMFEGGGVETMNHAMAVLRAVESRQFLMRSVKKGISSVINPHGSILMKSTSPNVTETLFTEISF